MRLINAEDFGRVIREYCKDCIEHNKQKMDIVDINADIQDFLDNQPIAFDVDKAISNIWDRSELIHIKHDCYDEVEDYIRVTDVSEIVKAGGLNE